MSCSEQVELQPAFHLPGSPLSTSGVNEATIRQIEKLRELEGECRIQDFQLLRLNYFKAFFFGLLMTASVLGLLLLKYYISLRALLFYSSLSPNEAHLATHLYVKASDKNQSICCIHLNEFEGRTRKVFMFKHLRYQLDGVCFPLGLRWEAREMVGAVKGLDQEEVHRRVSFLGKNQHLVEVPGYFQYLFDIMTQPFFIFQYLVSVVYILENVAIFGILMIAFGFITTSINYALLYRSYQQIKETAEKHFPVRVLRDGIFTTVENVDLVCGDVYVPGQEIPCDSVLVAGELFIDESSLTGESVPVPKFTLRDEREAEQSNHWVFQGSVVRTQKEGTLAMAVHIGFGSRRGRIIRKILTKRPKQPEFFRKLICFLLEVLLVSLLLFAGTVKQMFGLNIQKIMVFFRFLDFITYSFPAALPIFFNLTYSFCLVRLRRDGIYGTECEKTIEGARIKTICFDKTGTLTHNGMRVASVFTAQGGSMAPVELASHPLMSDLFGCCNSVEKINGNYEGDEIDLRMFHHAQAQIIHPPAQALDVIRCIQVADRLLEILRINEYESRFQSMSVLYRQGSRYFVVGKGSPEMIHLYSQSKVKGFDGFIKKMSLEGFRSIAFGCREITEKQAVALLKEDREAFLKKIDILGLVTFVNLLKEDAQSTIQALAESDINTKIITGDNIFLGVQTALMTGMISPGIKVVVLEGAKFRGESVEVTELEKLPSGEIAESQRVIEKFSFSNEEGRAFAIDNDFIKNNPESFLHGRVKVFARISPENKALIVRRHKEMIAAKIKTRPFWKRLFGECSVKVGMVGDGANDLIAIKDADVGIGISSSDAVYSASFAIKDLSQIVEILCESKNTQRQIVDLTQYYSIVSFITITTTLILTTDVSYMTSMLQIYKNFVTTLLMTLFFALSRPAKQLSKFLPNSNFMGVENHLVFWSSCMILSAGQVGAYYYYYNCSDFVENPKPFATFSDGWNGVCKSTTVNFLIVVLEYTLLPIIIYRSSPWKEAIYKNVALTVLIIINIVLIVPIYFETANLSFLDLQPIAQGPAAVIFIITIIGCIVCAVVNKAIQSSKMHETVGLQQEEANSAEELNVCK